MISMEMPEPPQQDLTLTPLDDDYRGAPPSPGAAEPLRRRVSVGGPVYRRVTVDTADDAELRYFLDHEAADSDFYALHLTCTLRPDADEPFIEALIELELVGDGFGRAPIAWSMQPDRLADVVEVTRTVSLGPTLKLQGFGADMKAERKQAAKRQQVFLEAMYELESTPSWGMYRTDAIELRGLYRFHLVVRAPKDSIVTGTTSVEAKVRRRRFGVVPYRAGLTDVPEPIAFTLGKAP